MSDPACNPQQLIEQHQGLVRSLAVKIHRRLPQRVELDDLIGYGEVGLAEAARDFDPGRGLQFSTFAYYRIRGAIYDGLSKMTWFGRAHYQQVRNEQMSGEVLRADAEKENDAGATAKTDDESELRWLRDLSRTLAVVYLASHADEKDHAGSDALVDTSTLSPLETAMRREIYHRLHQLIGCLPPESGGLIRAVYFEGLTLQEAGLRLGISTSWASRLHAKAIEQLGRSLRLGGAA